MPAAELIVSALLGAVASGRAYIMERPASGPLPAVVADIVSTVPQGTLNQTAGNNLFQARVQATCYASTHADLVTTIDAVFAAVHLKSGTYAGHTVPQVIVDSVFDGGYTEDPKIYFKSVDFLVLFYA